MDGTDGVTSISQSKADMFLNTMGVFPKQEVSSPELSSPSERPHTSMGCLNKQSLNNSRTFNSQRQMRGIYLQKHSSVTSVIQSDESKTNERKKQEYLSPFKDLRDVA